ncbi:hypothetical protein EDB83DRAFT_242023 [Lactarius deliciosus]|nr:hypothetical protein EDB83DRAFT_242023 [Lactarius deliciosus]
MPEFSILKHSMCALYRPSPCLVLLFITYEYHFAFSLAPVHAAPILVQYSPPSVMFSSYFHDARRLMTIYPAPYSVRPSDASGVARGVLGGSSRAREQGEWVGQGMMGSMTCEISAMTLHTTTTFRVIE